MAGKFKPGSFGGWLSAAKVGDQAWIEGQTAASLTGTAHHHAKKIETRTYYAIHPSTLETAVLVRVTMLGEL